VVEASWGFLPTGLSPARNLDVRFENFSGRLNTLSSVGSGGRQIGRLPGPKICNT
jgi:hypothetical protein